MTARTLIPSLAAVLLSAARPATPADQHPDLNGYWAARPTGTWDLTNPQTGGGRLQVAIDATKGIPEKPKPSRVFDPPDGKIPYQPWARDKQQSIAAHVDAPLRPEHVDTQARCLVNGPIRSFFHAPVRIVQTPDQLVILEEDTHSFRSIPLDGSPHPGKDIQLWMGDSRGHWEGQTLVIDVTNLNGKARLDMVANFYSPAAHIVERLTPVDADTISYEATVEDPSVYTRPWSLRAKLIRLHKDDPDYEMFEDSCHEGEQSADTLVLSGEPGR